MNRSSRMMCAALLLLPASAASAAPAAAADTFTLATPVVHCGQPITLTAPPDTADITYTEEEPVGATYWRVVAMAVITDQDTRFTTPLPRGWMTTDTTPWRADYIVAADQLCPSSQGNAHRNPHSNRSRHWSSW